MSLKLKIEKHFNLPMEQIIEVKHLKDNISLNELSKQCGVTRQSFTNIAKGLGLKTRSVKEATKLTKNKGEKHFNFGKTKETSALCLDASRRIKRKNPAKDLDIRKKMSASLALYFSKNPWPQEVKFKNILEKYNIKYSFQVPIDIYVVDFFVKDKNLCIEIDSKEKLCKKKLLRQKKKDKILSKLGYKVLRISKNKLKDEAFILNILKCYDLIG